MTATVLVVGGGGREHAIGYALRGVMDVDDAQARDITIHVCAGNRNPGLARLADSVETLDTSDPGAVVEFAESVDTDIAIIGPESPLAAGVVDALEEVGIHAFGPTADGARIETDKGYQREFMADNEIPGCPDFEVVDSVDAACDYIDEYDGDLAVKPTGLTGGKGVKVIGDQVTAEEAKAYVQSCGHDSFVLEERLIGEEFTVQAFVDGDTLRVTPAIQDHKRAYEGDEGPNTGGMGSYSAPALALPFMDEDDYHRAIEILQATVQALGDYRGILYGQFMLTADGVKVIEYNARFGDPEAMNTLPVMNTNLLDILLASRDGEELPQLSFVPRATVCKYAVPQGYPDDPADGVKLDIEHVEVDGAMVFHASVDDRDDGIYSTTSRAFAAVGIGETIAEAEERAEAGLAAVGIDDLHVRHDVGTADLIDSRIEHVSQLREV